jgi:hypothetical protein
MTGENCVIKSMLTRYEIVGMNIRLFGGGIFIGYFDGFGY